MKVLGVTGWKNMGKTTLTERLIAAYTAQGLRVSAIKHTHHGVDLEREGTDTYRHREAGAGQVVLASARRLAVLTELRDAPEWEVGDILNAMLPADLVLIEGYKNTAHPKIEVYRHEAARGRAPLALEFSSIRAIVGDPGEYEVPVPVHDPKDLEAIAALGLSLAQDWPG